MGHFACPERCATHILRLSAPESTRTACPPELRASGVLWAPGGASTHTLSIAPAIVSGYKTGPRADPPPQTADTS